MDLEQAIWQKLIISFDGKQPPREVRELLKAKPVGGVTLFRLLNVDSPAQVRELTAGLQRAARGAERLPLLIATDQEGGQLMAIGGDSTPFPGNLALGAARSSELSRRVGAAIGAELAAMGINVNYAPVCDVNLNPLNPVVGTRSFGEDPACVARLAAAMVEGFQSAGVAATAKHFPGHGDSSSDPHYGAPVVSLDEQHLRQTCLPPFAAAIEAGVRLVMSAHVVVPAVNDQTDLPATLSPSILRGLLRGELGFHGLIASDAMDMGAIRQGPGLPIDSIAAVAAGIDLLLLDSLPENWHNVYAGLLQATRRSLLDEADIQASAARVLDLKRWLAGQEQPALDVVGCAEHRALARAVAEQSITLVRDSRGLLPIKLDPAQRLAVVFPLPEDLTPADTSSYVVPALAETFRRFHPTVDEYRMPINPTPEQVAELRAQLAGYDLLIAGTINATQNPGQAALVNALLAGDAPVVTVALRMPYDLQVYPAAPVFLCTYSILPPAIEALARALWGEIPCVGRLPVTIPLAMER